MSTVTAESVGHVGHVSAIKAAMADTRKPAWILAFRALWALRVGGVGHIYLLSHKKRKEKEGGEKEEEKVSKSSVLMADTADTFQKNARKPAWMLIHKLSEIYFLWPTHGRHGAPMADTFASKP